MKTLFLKNMMPIAVVALGLSGAFVTTSMQSVSKAETAPKVGYVRIPNTMKCSDVSVNCNTTPTPFLCQLGANIAYDKDPATNNCVQPLYRP
jgi:hypothetical protein